MKATYDQDRYDFEASRAPIGERRARRRSSVAEDEAKRLSELNLAMREGRRRQGATIQKQLGQYTGEVGDGRRSRSRR